MFSKCSFGTALFAAALTLCGPATSQTYPSKPVRIVVPSVPGGATDIAARALAPHLSRALRATVVVDNRPGPTGNIAAGTVAKAPADGYTLLLATSALAVSPAIRAKLAYEPAKDFVPIGGVMAAPLVLLVQPSLPAKSATELVALAKAQPARLRFGHPGNGSVEQLCGEMFARAARITVAAAPYKQALQSGRAPFAEVQYAFANVAHALPHLSAGEARAIAVTTLRRYALLPSVPALSETLPGFEFPGWQALFAPALTPPAVLRQLEAAVATAMDSKDVAAQLTAHGIEPVPASGEELRTFLPREIARWAARVRDTGVRIE